MSLSILKRLESSPRPARTNETPSTDHHPSFLLNFKILSFTCCSALLLSLKICPTTLVADVMFAGVNILALAVKIWASEEIALDSVVMLSICLKMVFFSESNLYKYS